MKKLFNKLRTKQRDETDETPLSKVVQQDAEARVDWSESIDRIAEQVVYETTTTAGSLKCILRSVRPDGTLIFTPCNAGEGAKFNVRVVKTEGTKVPIAMGKVVTLDQIAKRIAGGECYAVVHYDQVD